MAFIERHGIQRVYNDILARAARDSSRAEARQADSGQNVQENFDAGQHINEDHDAPQKDQYISPSESESVSEAESPPPLAKIFRRGQLMYHAAHKGPVPVGYVDTGLYLGGKHDYYEAYDKRDLLWARRMDHVLRTLGVQRWKD